MPIQRLPSTRILRKSTFSSLFMKSASSAITFMIAILVAVIPMYSWSAENSTAFYVVYNVPNKDFVLALTNELQKDLPNLSIRAKDISTLSDTESSIVLVTTGTSTLNDVLSSPYHRQRKIVSTLVSSTDFLSAIAAHKNQNLRITALYSDPPIDKQVHLASLLLHKPQIAFIYDDKSKSLMPQINVAVNQYNLPKPIYLEYKGENINQFLRSRKATDADFLLASPNPEFYNQRNSKAIIFTLLSQGQAMIGYSSGWVSSGALATTYSDKSDITKSIAELLNEVAQSSSPMPQPRYSKYFDLKINNKVAKVLDIPIKSEKQMLNSLRDSSTSHVK